MNEKQLKQLQRAKDHAKSKGGECLSNEYVKCDIKLEWKCANPNHKSWLGSFDKVVNSKRWCPECAKERTPHNKHINALDLAREFAISRGGECLSTEYINVDRKLIWKCSNPRHKLWEATFSNVVNSKNWCYQCGVEQRGIKKRNPLGLQTANEIAKSRGGECLSTEYVNANKRMIWKCANPKHKPWEATFSNVVNHDRWCPECSNRRLSEQRTRLIFERFFGKSFPSVKPTWNINPWTYRHLELDGYCHEFQVAFEYDGEHHFEATRGNKKKDLIYQQFKDHQKQKNCIKQGVLLINVPYIKEQCRAKFQPFLENVVLACKGMGLEMVFSPDQLVDLERDFYAVQ